MTTMEAVKAAARKMAHETGAEGTNDGEHEAALELLGALGTLFAEQGRPPACCHSGALLRCPHPCPACRIDEAGQVVADILAFARQCRRDEETDTGRAWELLNKARKLLNKITKEAA